MSSSPRPSTPLEKLNGRSLNDSPSLDSGECLDLSIKEFHVITYYPGSYPGKEYEIWSEKDLVDNWDVLEKGVSVVVQLGNCKLQGTVLYLSDNLEYIKSNFERITQEHREQLLESKKKGNSKNRNKTRKEQTTEYRDKETQTDNSGTNSTNDDDYQDLKKKYDELKFEFEKFTALFADVKINLEDTVAKLQSVNIDTKNGSFSSSMVSTDKKKDVLKQLDNVTEDVDCFNRMIQIGSSGSKIPKTAYDSINWNSYTAATRKLLITLFTRKVLATHSLTGKPSPAFLTCDKQKKFRLDAAIISDIVEVVSKNCKVSESMVRNVITTKCADENKMYRKRLQRRKENETETETDENKKPRNV